MSQVVQIILPGPGVPTPQQPSLVSVTASTATISGANPGGTAATMHVYRNGVKLTSGNGVPFGSYTDNGPLTSSTSYDYQVAAVDGSGNPGALSPIRVVTTQGAPVGGAISFAAGISPRSLVVGVPPALDLDSLLATGAPAAGWAWENPPDGLSLDVTNGIISGAPSTAQSRDTVIVASTVSPEDAEWNLIANNPANVFATRFDTDADLYGPSRYVDASATNWHEAYVYGPNGPGFATAFVPGINPYVSRLTNGGIAGRGAMRLTLPGDWTGANPGGWRRLFIDPNDPSRTWGYGTKFCMRIGIKTDAASLGTWAFDNWKILLLAGAGKSGWGQTCAINEISTFHYGHNTIYNYTRCGSGQMYEPDFPYAGAFRMQNMSDRGAGVTNPDLRYCTYNGRNDVLAGGACYKWRANVWTTIYYEITPNANGSMRFQQWVQYEGATQYTPLYDFLVPAGDWGLQDEAFGGLWNTLTMTLQTTGKNAASGFDVTLDVGEIVIRRGVSIPPRTRWT